jgi:hypothetical protein
VAFSPDGTRIVSGSYDETIQIWDAQTGEEVVEPLEGHTDIVQPVTFSPDGTRIVSGPDDETIQIWDLKIGEEVVEPLKGHTDFIVSVAFSPDGTRIVSSSIDKTIIIWDAMTGQAAVKRLKGQTSLVASVAISSDETRIVSDRAIRIPDVMPGEVVMTASARIPKLTHLFGNSSAGTTVSNLMRFHPFSASCGWIEGPAEELIFWVLPEWRTFMVWPPCLLSLQNLESRSIYDTLFMEQTGQDVSQTLRVIIILYVMLLRYFLYLFFCLTVSVPLCVCVDIDRPSSFFPNSLYFYSYMTFLFGPRCMMIYGPSII